MQFGEKYSIFPGLGFGFHQPIVVGRIHIGTSFRFSPDLLQLCMRGLIEEMGVIQKIPSQPERFEQIPQWVLDWAHILERLANIPVLEQSRVLYFGRTSSDLYSAIFVAPYINPNATRDVISWVVGVVEKISLAQGQEMRDVALQLAQQELKRLFQRLRTCSQPGINTDRMLRVAVEREIPFMPLEAHSFIVGHGRHNRWLNSTFTDATSHLGATRARNKSQAASILKRHGLPVARHLLVRTANEAVDKARQIGYPVVIKPANLDGGIGVHAGLTSEDQVRRCFADAAKHSDQILVEKFHAGRDYRLTVFQGKLIKAIERTPGGVTGDGKRNIRELLEQVATSPDALRRMGERRKRLLSFDIEAEELLAEVDLTLDSIPAAGHFVKLRRRANVSTGGTTTLVMDQVHPDNRRLAERAADVMRLDIAGIDLLIPDISRSWLDTGAIICEVNAQPQVSENGTPGLYSAMFGALLGGDGRIPVTLVLTDRTDRMQMMRWARAYGRNATGTVLVSPYGLYLDGECLCHEDMDFVALARAGLACREAERALLVTTPEILLGQGLPCAIIDTLVLAISNGDSIASRRLGKLIQPHLKGLVAYTSTSPLSSQIVEEHSAEKCLCLTNHETDAAIEHLLEKRQNHCERSAASCSL